MSTFVWVAVVILTMTTLYFFWRWRVGIKSSVYLTNFVLLMMFDEKERAYQEENLLKFIRASDYANAETLSAMVSSGLVKIATMRAAETMMPMCDRLWGMSREHTQ